MQGGVVVAHRVFDDAVLFLGERPEGDRVGVAAGRRIVVARIVVARRVFHRGLVDRGRYVARLEIAKSLDLFGGERPVEERHLVHHAVELVVDLLDLVRFALFPAGAEHQRLRVAEQAVGVAAVLAFELAVDVELQAARTEGHHDVVPLLARRRALVGFEIGGLVFALQPDGDPAGAVVFVVLVFDPQMAAVAAVFRILGDQGHLCLGGGVVPETDGAVGDLESVVMRDRDQRLPVPWGVLRERGRFAVAVEAGAGRRDRILAVTAFPIGAVVVADIVLGRAAVVLEAPVGGRVELLDEFGVVLGRLVAVRRRVVGRFLGRRLGDRGRVVGRGLIVHGRGVVDRRCIVDRRHVVQAAGDVVFLDRRALRDLFQFDEGVVDDLDRRVALIEHADAVAAMVDEDVVLDQQVAVAAHADHIVVAAVLGLDDGVAFDDADAAVVQADVVARVAGAVVEHRIQHMGLGGAALDVIGGSLRVAEHAVDHGDLVGLADIDAVGQAGAAVGAVAQELRSFDSDFVAPHVRVAEDAVLVVVEVRIPDDEVAAFPADAGAVAVGHLGAGEGDVLDHRVGLDDQDAFAVGHRLGRHQLDRAVDADDTDIVADGGEVVLIDTAADENRITVFGGGDCGSNSLEVLAAADPDFAS